MMRANFLYRILRLFLIILTGHTVLYATEGRMEEKIIKNESHHQAHTIIIETEHIEVVERYLKTLTSLGVGFIDVDFTLVTPISKLFRRSSPYREQVLNIFRKRESFKPDPAIVGEFHLKRKTMLVSEKWPSIISSSREKEVPIYALSQAETGALGPIKSMKEWRYEELKSNGIVFKEDFQGRTEETLRESESGSPSMFYKGAFLTGSFKKSDIIKEYFLRLFPDVTVFVDDREDHVLDGERGWLEVQVKSSKPTSFVGIIYRGVDLLEGSPSPQAAELQIQSLLTKHQWIEDDEAEQMVQ